MSEATPAEEGRRRLHIPPRAVRIGVVIGVLIVGWIIAWSTGCLDEIDADTVRGAIASWGIWAILGYVVLCCLANLVHIPGNILVVGGILAFGPVTGGFVGLAGAVIAATTTFVTMRAVGGKGTSEVKNKLAKRILGGLEKHPTWTIALLRILFQNNAILNTVLALSPVSLRGYLLGTVLGMIPPVIVLAVLTGWVV